MRGGILIVVSAIHGVVGYFTRKIREILLGKPYVIKYGYDNNGNRTSATNAGLTTTYLYDGVDRLTRINYPQPGTPYSSYEYNGDGLRVKVREKTGLITRYVWSGSDVINEYTDTWTLLKSYYLGGGLEGLIAGTTYSYYHPDALGSIMKITGSTGTITDTYDFDEFGGQIMSQGTTPNVYRYTGQQSDADSALLYLRARYYEPSTGRFITKDPFKGNRRSPMTLNPYLYCLNNPINMKDPSGLVPDCEFPTDLTTLEEAKAYYTGVRQSYGLMFSILGFIISFAGGEGEIALPVWLASNYSKSAATLRAIIVLVSKGDLVMVSGGVISVAGLAMMHGDGNWDDGRVPDEIKDEDGIPDLSSLKTGSRAIAGPGSPNQIHNEGLLEELMRRHPEYNNVDLWQHRSSKIFRDASGNKFEWHYWQYDKTPVYDFIKPKALGPWR